jgi:hypothetical protein
MKNLTITTVPLCTTAKTYTDVWIGIIEKEISIQLSNNNSIERIFAQKISASFIDLWYIAMLYTKIELNSCEDLSVLLFSLCKTTVLCRQNYHQSDLIERNFLIQYLPNGKKDLDEVYTSLPPIEYLKNSILLCKQAGIVFNSLELRKFLQQYERTAVSSGMFLLIDSYESDQT